MNLDTKVLKSANMTQNQLVMWMAQKMSGRRPIYNMGMAIRIASDLDTDRFRKSFDFVIRKSDNMRSVFRFVDGGPRRIVLDFEDMQYDLPVLDFTDRPEQVNDWMQEQLRDWLDLRKQLFRSVLLRVGHEEFIWFICQHHLICDGWSFSNLTSSVGNRYAQLEAGDSSDVHFPEYGDFVERELDYYDSERCAESSTYWQKLLGERLPKSSMYGLGSEHGKTDFQRVSRQLSGDLIDRMKSAIASKQFRAFSEDQGMLLLWLTALVLQLKRATGNDRLGIGVCLHNRLSPQDKETLGTFFICSAMRVRIEPDDTFGTLYKRVAKEYRSMLRHYRHPVLAAQEHRNWDITINYVNKTFPKFAGRPIGVTWLHSDTYLANAPVGLQIQRFNTGEGMTAEWDFNKGIFGTDERRETAMADFEEAMDFGLENPDFLLSEYFEVNYLRQAQGSF
jgi:hypothetical protein